MPFASDFKGGVMWSKVFIFTTNNMAIRTGGYLSKRVLPAFFIGQISGGGYDERPYLKVLYTFRISKWVESGVVTARLSCENGWH